MENYILLAVFFRFTVDFLLLLATKRLSSREPGLGRMLLACGVGAGCALLGTLFPIGFFRSWFYLILTAVLICLTAFGVSKKGLPTMAVFCLLRLSVDGLVGSTEDRMDIFWAAVLLGVCLYGFRGGMGAARIVPVELYHGGRTVKLRALRDTGNTLRDPITGKSVLVVDAVVADLLTGLSLQQLEKPVESLGQIPGLRLIPYRGVGQPGGMLLGLSIKETRVGKRKGSLVVAFAPQILDEKGKYQALVGEFL